MAERFETPGLAVGLAWTALGGEILFIEATEGPAVNGGGSLKLTGQMGDVMSESAEIAWTTVKRKAQVELGTDGDSLKKKEFHLHIPAGAIPKDGPSAGITMATTLYSLLSGRVVRPRLAMTGELSLTGKVLPVGGIKEKLLAARRAGVDSVILSHRNEKDVAELQPEALGGLRIHYVRTLDEVFALALEPRDAVLLKPKMLRRKRPRTKVNHTSRTARSRTPSSKRVPR